jgi:hypothetical protein
MNSASKRCFVTNHPATRRDGFDRQTAQIEGCVKRSPMHEESNSFPCSSVGTLPMPLRGELSVRPGSYSSTRSSVGTPAVVPIHHCSQVRQWLRLGTSSCRFESSSTTCIDDKNATL